jgi:hypothetical protein
MLRRALQRASFRVSFANDVDAAVLAVLAGGRIQLLGKPGELVDTLQGRIWRKIIVKEELAAHQQQYNVISTRLSAGKTVVHVMAEQQPGDGFIQLTPDLEDVYFSTLFKSRQAA